MNLKIAAAVVALVSLGAMVGAARAQDAAPDAKPATGEAQQRGPGGRSGMRGGQLPYKAAFKAVAPTPEQQSKFDALEKTMTQDMTALRQSAPEERRSKMRDLSTKFEKDVEALLTPEQLPVYKDALEKERKRVAGGLMAQLETLNLTADQKAKIEPIVRDAMTEMQKLRQDPAADRQTMRQKMTELIDGMKSKIRPLLTPEQQTKFDALQFGRGGRRQ